MEMEGETFSHVFGTNTALFEQFVLCRNVMGPCWLKIEKADFASVQNVIGPIALYTCCEPLLILK